MSFARRGRTNTKEMEEFRIESEIQRDKFLENKNDKKYGWIFKILKQRYFFLFFSLICLIIHGGITYYGIILNLLMIPALGFFILQPISFLFFNLFHSISTLGFIPSLFFLFNTLLINWVTEIINSYTNIPYSPREFNSNSYDNIMLLKVPGNLYFSIFL